MHRGLSVKSSRAKLPERPRAELLVVGALCVMAGAAMQVVPSEVWVGAMTVLLVAMAFLDLRQRRVPNSLVYPALTVGVIGPALAGQQQLFVALQGGVVAFVLMFVLALVGRGAMGMADVKVAALCGLLLGPYLAIVAIAMMSVSAAVVALLLLITRRAHFGDALPLVPFMAAVTVLFLINGSGSA